jgi:surfeit locus 1 family protein
MKFRFRPALTAAALPVFAVLVALGVWQLQRLSWKRDLVARLEARLAEAPIPLDLALARARAGEDVDYQPVRARGTYLHGLSVRVFGTLDGVPGAYIFTPLERERGKPVVLVNRGFAPQSLAPDDLAKGEAAGEVEIVGLLRAPEKTARLFAFLAPEDQPEDALFFRRDPAAIAAAKAIDAPPWYVDGSGRENPAAWPRGGVTRVEFPNRHLEYALTWFGLAAALVGVFFAYSRRD